MLHAGTRNKLDYIAVKLDNMIHEFYVDDAVNPRFTPNLEAVEALAEELSIIGQFVHDGKQPQGDDWMLIKKYCALADEFRTRKSIG